MGKKQPEGLHGIIINPRGERGFLSKVGDSIAWIPVKEGQDATCVVKLARAL